MSKLPDGKYTAYAERFENQREGGIVLIIREGEHKGKGIFVLLHRRSIDEIGIEENKNE